MLFGSGRKENIFDSHLNRTPFFKTEPESSAVLNGQRADRTSKITPFAQNILYLERSEYLYG